MSLLWKETEMPNERKEINELKEIEVDEVSLVDRPATGKRFLLFKRGGPVREGEEDTNKCSDGAALNAIAKRLDDLADAVHRLDALADLSARVDEAARLLKRLEDEAGAAESRLDALERAHPVRQSAGAATPRDALWAGLL